MTFSTQNSIFVQLCCHCLYTHLLHGIALNTDLLSAIQLNIEAPCLAFNDSILQANISALVVSRLPQTRIKIF
jgi:hypothetical protein